MSDPKKKAPKIADAPAPAAPPAFDPRTAAPVAAPFNDPATHRTVAWMQPAGDGRSHFFGANRKFIATGTPPAEETPAAADSAAQPVTEPEAPASND